MDEDLGALFGGVVVPEATPSPRTIRFATPPLGDGPSRSFTRGDAVDAPAQQVFAVSEDVTGVLVGPNFVAVTIARPDAWESLLAPLVRAVTDAFTGTTPARTVDPTAAARGPGEPVADREPRRLERAWRELGTPSADTDGGDRVDRLVAATHDRASERRQVAAALLVDLDPELAATHWARLLTDESRSVRRATVDTVGDAHREELRPLLETALGDVDPWIRWRAVRGLAQLGADASRDAVTALATDPDFRVRLEAARVIDG